MSARNNFIHRILFPTYIVIGLIGGLFAHSVLLFSSIPELLNYSNLDPSLTRFIYYKIILTFTYYIGAYISIFSVDIFFKRTTIKNKIILAMLSTLSTFLIFWFLFSYE